MNYIYHEKQEGSLCGQHCLNNLLQGQFFSAVELAEIAQQMDQEEQRRMAELGTHTQDFRNFLEQPSSNMDDSGMFSVQVLTSALKIWDLSLVPFASSSSSLAVTARENPVEQQAYICNFKEHWFTIRKLGRQWFNLNSLLTFPELISDTYLSLFLTQLQHEGYAIFVLEGALPPCEAHDALNIYPAVQTIKPQLLAEEVGRAKEDQDLKAALMASLAKAGLGGAPSASSSLQGRRMKDEDEEEEDEDLRAAMLMSLAPASASTQHSPFRGSHEADEDNVEEAIRLSLKASLEGEGAASSSSSSAKKCLKNRREDGGGGGGDDLERALQMSLNSALCQVRVPANPLDDEEEKEVANRTKEGDREKEEEETPDLDQIRRKRLAKLDAAQDNRDK